MNSGARTMFAISNLCIYRAKIPCAEVLKHQTLLLGCRRVGTFGREFRAGDCLLRLALALTAVLGWGTLLGLSSGVWHLLAA